MALGIWVTQAGGADSSELTAAAADVIKGKTAITSDSDGDPITGTLELTGNATAAQVMSGYTFYSADPKTKLTGTMTIQSVVNFKVAQYSSLNIICSWALPSRGPWSGIRIVAKQGSYPTGVNDGTLVYHGSGTSAIKALAAGTWYIRAWNYATINGAAVYGGYAQAMVSNQQIRGAQTYTASGVFTVPDKVYAIDVFCVGGGGGGGMFRRLPRYQSGGAGGYTATRKAIAVTPGQQFPVTIGAGGSAPVGSTSDTSRGNDGGATSFSSLLSAIGGGGGGNWGNGTSSRPYVSNGGSGGGYTGISYSEYSTRDGGRGGSDGSNGCDYDGTLMADDENNYLGQHTTTRAFGESGGTLYAGGGGGGGAYNQDSDSGHSTYSKGGLGGDGGGGRGSDNHVGGGYTGYAAAGTAGTGGGGGGGSNGKFGNGSYSSDAAAGGSGICIIRWGY